MRRRINAQTGISFQPDCLPETTGYYAKYNRIDDILRDNPKILSLVHRDLEKSLRGTDKRSRRSKYSSDQVLRIAIAQVIEGESLRDISVRIDDSEFLRKFTRIYNGKMMSFTTFCSLRNKISPETWAKVNVELAKHAVEQEMIVGDKLRVDTTAVETNIHWPTDSSLLWDTYRKCATLLCIARKRYPEIFGGRRLQKKRAKRLCQKITRHLSDKAKKGKKPEKLEQARTLYSELISMVDDILTLVQTVHSKLVDSEEDPRNKRLRPSASSVRLAMSMEYYYDLGRRVVSQAERRVIEGEKVPADEKVYSIFEEHTELLKRGKAGKPIEFGHMILLQQVEGCFVTNYKTFDPKPKESELLRSIVENHIELFGSPPGTLTADRGFYSGMDDVHELEKRIDVVSVCKKGRRTQDEEAREHSATFKAAQRFRAGIEGSISVLKRCFGMFRCMRKGWEHFSAMVGNAVFAHNLCVLARC